MRITIFGATGATGRLLTQQALAKGYGAVAHARNPAKLDIQHDRLKIVHGELENQAALEEAVQGRDGLILARLPLLNNQPKQGRVNTGYVGEGKINLLPSRGDLADFLLAQLEDDTFIRNAPVICN